MRDDGKYRRNSDGRFAPGTGGRPLGARNLTTRAVEALLDGEAEAVTRAVIAKARDGDMVAARLVVERILPPRKDRPVRFDLPPLERPADGPQALAAIAEAAAEGELTPGEASDIAGLVGKWAEARSNAELLDRLARLEAHIFGEDH